MKGIHLIYVILPLMVIIAWQQVRAESAREQLVKIRNELANKRQYLHQARKQEKVTFSKIRANQEEMRQKALCNQKAEKQIQALQSGITLCQKQTDEVRSTQKQRESMKAIRAVELHKQLVTADELPDIMASQVYASLAVVCSAAAIEYDNAIISGHTAKIISLEQQKASLLANKKQQEIVKVSSQKEYSLLEKDTHNYKIKLTTIQKDQEKITAEIREYEAQQNRLKALIARLSRPQKNQAKRPAIAGRRSETGFNRPLVSMPADFEKFRLPVAGGKVVRGYGLYRHPDWGTSTFSNGLSITAEAGAPVRAIAGGTVAYAGNLKGYGNIIIIDHGQQVFSVYSQCGNILKSVGALVKKGENIAKAGLTEGDRPALYFELRSRGKAVNPSKWIVG